MLMTSDPAPAEPLPVLGGAGVIPGVFSPRTTLTRVGVAVVRDAPFPPRRAAGAVFGQGPSFGLVAKQSFGRK